MIHDWRSKQLCRIFGGWILLTAAIASCRESETIPPPLHARMSLGAASNFSQGWNEQTYDTALELPISRLRDSIRWADVETIKGHYDFGKPATAYPSKLGAADIRLTLTLNWGNPLYDGGNTPYSPEGLAAFGRFAAEVVRRFSAIDTIEIGNEVNGKNFVSGPVKAAGLAERRRYHLAMVQAAAAAVHAIRPEVSVIGGSTHSLPSGYLWSLLDMPGANALQGLTVHPYTTPIDQLRGQLAELRRNERVRSLPLYVTEIGSRQPAKAADDLLRSYAMLASLGVKEMDWYPLNQRGDGMVPLIARDGSITSAGAAFRLVRERLSQHTAKDISPDPFTFIIAFGDHIQVMWGARRAVTINPAEVDVYDATGSRMTGHTLALDEDSTVVLVGKRPLSSGTDAKLGCNPLLADSFYQFNYPPKPAYPEGFETSIRIAGHNLPLETMPGQQRPGSLWTPYLGHHNFAGLRLTASTMLPAFRGGDGAIVHRYVADRDRELRLVAKFNSPEQRGGTVVVALAVAEEALAPYVIDGPVTIDRNIALRKGEAVTFTTRAQGSSRGGTIDYRIQLMAPANSCNALPVM